MKYLLKYYGVYTTCSIVKGYSRAVICDLNRGDFKLIPLQIADYLTQSTPVSLQDFIQKTDIEDPSEIEDWIEYLMQEDLIYEVEAKAEPFNAVSLTYDVPYQLTNAVVDCRDESIFLLSLEKLKPFEFQAIQLRFWNPITIEKLQEITVRLNQLDTRSIELLVPFHPGFTTDELVDLTRACNKIFIIKIYGSPFEHIISNDFSKMGTILWSTESTVTKHSCGAIHPDMFVTNMSLFTESQQYNSCLNRKISIDADGEIRNCPSMKASYGNIKTTEIQTVVANPEFKKYWMLAKDQISVCKDCEFRHVCTDCRAYLENPDDLYSKPLKCGYDPYSCTWEEWSTNVLKQTAIDHYGFRKILPEFKMKQDYAPVN